MVDKYTITFHFTGTTITVTYNTDKERDDVFKALYGIIDLNSSFFLEVDEETIVNLKQVLCITKGKQQEWKSATEH